MDASAYLAGCTDRFDIALVDPPYGQKKIDEVLPQLAGRMNENGIIVCETERTEELPGQAGEFSIYKVYRYGKAKVTTYKKTAEDE